MSATSTLPLALNGLAIMDWSNPVAKALIIRAHRASDLDLQHS